MLGLRTVVVRRLGLLGILIIARCSSRRTSGVLAFGQTLTAIGALFTDVGIAAGLRRERPPSRRGLQTILDFQLAVTSALVCIIAAFAVPTAVVGRSPRSWRPPSF